VRKAFAHSVDREDFVRAADVVHLRAAKGGFLPPGMAGHSGALGLAYDPEAARRLLAQAGYPNGSGFPDVELAYSGVANDDSTASYLGRAWEQALGVRVKLSRLEWGELLRRNREDPPDLTISGWAADYPDADAILRVAVHSAPLRWTNEAFDALIDQAARLTDRKGRVELYEKADRILVAEEAVVLPLGYVLGRQLIQPYVRLPRTPPYLLRLKHAVVQRGSPPRV
jgi:oligopeptide transport system substrate-binding protein